MLDGTIEIETNKGSCCSPFSSLDAGIVVLETGGFAVVMPSVGCSVLVPGTGTEAAIALADNKARTSKWSWQAGRQAGEGCCLGQFGVADAPVLVVGARSETDIGGGHRHN
jgi:hypothetical protein